LPVPSGTRSGANKKHARLTEASALAVPLHFRVRHDGAPALDRGNGAVPGTPRTPRTAYAGYGSGGDACPPAPPGSTVSGSLEERHGPTRSVIALRTDDSILAVMASTR